MCAKIYFAAIVKYFYVGFCFFCAFKHFVYSSLNGLFNKMWYKNKPALPITKDNN